MYSKAIHEIVLDSGFYIVKIDSQYREARQCALGSVLKTERMRREYIYIKIGVFNLKENFKYYYFIEK